MNDASRPHRLFLIDGSGYIFRAFHALPPLTREDGTPINAVLGFTNMIYKLINETDADAIAVIFDAGRSSFRNDLYGDYKAHRPDAPPELVPQFGLIRDATRAFNLPSEPWLFVIDRNGIIRTATEGAFSVDELTKAVKGVTGG